MQYGGILQGPNSSTAYVKSSGPNTADVSSPFDKVSLNGKGDNSSKDELGNDNNRKGAKLAFTNKTEINDEEKWKATLDAVCALLLPKKIFRVVASDCKPLLAKEMMKSAMVVLCNAGLFNVETNTLVEKNDPEVGYLQEKCLPFHILAVACLLQGKKISINIFKKILEIWDEIKVEALKGLDNPKLAHKVLYVPFVEHAKGAYWKYHALLFCNTNKFLCHVKGTLIIEWETSLKNEVAKCKKEYMAVISQAASKAALLEKEAEIQQLKEELRLLKAKQP